MAPRSLPCMWPFGTMMSPRCAIGIYSETIVLSFPPCGPAEDLKAPAGLPFPLRRHIPQMGRVLSMIPSAHSASAGVGAPYSPSVLLLPSCQPCLGHRLRQLLGIAGWL
jgi:hypothetical protein